ncbi:inositol monophosphatase [Palleronia sp. LCG004]|uniref:inositol monophosphatase family protein n=1 Tax=Palleronia sp. LCG004 TaxID=3079304 RepID=UPI002942F630|nr:inositol monophosphatase [Palleronia sp. LCG004]WOI57795.1 inositol monophosphatase [Palleronia sp. LCG004]
MSGALDADARLAVAERIAREAGALAKEYFDRRETLAVETKRVLQDMVSEADRDVERMIRTGLSEAFPDDAQLGEEHGHLEGTSGLTWVIDPIDGTAPFLAGLPGWCVCVGACDDAGPLIGVIHAPILGETFVAARGRGATLNGSAIRVTDRFDLSTGLLGIGANDRVPHGNVGDMLAAFMEAGASWTRYGSGALMLAWVAAGRLVGYVEPRMSAWDCMAAYCLIEEAGGRVLPFPQGEAMLRPAPVLGASPRCYEQILELSQLTDDAVWGGRDNRG